MIRKMRLNSHAYLVSRVIAVVFAVATGLLSTSCSNNSYDGMVVAVALAENVPASCSGAKIIAIDPEHPGKKVSHLSSDFESACAPALSHDGRYLYFQGKQNDRDPWQIWEMDLKKKSTTRVTNLPENCTDPASLPDGNLVFSRSDTIKNREVSSLFRCNRDGSELVRITYGPGLNQYSTVTRDGRVLFSSSQQYPDSKDPVLMVMRPDGTKGEIFYRGSSGSFPVSRAMESDLGYVYFIEENGSQKKPGTLIRIHQNRPLHTRVDLSEGIDGTFSAVIPWKENSCMVSYQPAAGENFALYTLETTPGNLPVLLYGGEGHITNPVHIAPMEERPRILPSAVNPDNPTGIIMSQDINHSLVSAYQHLKGDTMASRVAVYGLDGLIGETAVKADGSFYLKIDSDTPFRFFTLNELGETVRGPSE